ncbi:hypothetical protein CcaverHIS002_0504450 [Cutaneotrichosporon cavernicola]|nr:hypothetical protein CcaverHIS002_0504450 [Cutaneotrichosporon cavernicola]BEJ00647.1 hypothetical protein CcaverHIS631_0505040 [Cutaneotrichosporon cavernicola]BEJ08412.1 hypothetical protein CcaverHIS641_0504970 [Cutaneotrichosporon cavernicola]
MRVLSFLFVAASAAAAAAAVPIPDTTCSPVRVLLDSAAAVFGLQLSLCVPPQEEHHAYQDPGYYPDGVDLDELNFGDFEPLPDFHEYAQIV